VPLFRLLQYFCARAHFRTQKTLSTLKLEVEGRKEEKWWIFDRLMSIFGPPYAHRELLFEYFLKFLEKYASVVIVVVIFVTTAHNGDKWY